MNGRQRRSRFEVHSEARGPHWVAWISQAGEAGPHRSVLLVGASKEEAEAKRPRVGRAHGGRQAGRPVLVVSDGS